MTSAVRKRAVRKCRTFVVKAMEWPRSAVDWVLIDKFIRDLLNSLQSEEVAMIGNDNQFPFWWTSDYIKESHRKWPACFFPVVEVSETKMIPCRITDRGFDNYQTVHRKENVAFARILAGDEVHLESWELEKLVKKVGRSAWKKASAEEKQRYISLYLDKLPLTALVPNMIQPPKKPGTASDVPPVTPKKKFYRRQKDAAEFGEACMGVLFETPVKKFSSKGIQWAIRQLASIAVSRCNGRVSLRARRVLKHQVIKQQGRASLINFLILSNKNTHPGGPSPGGLM